MHTPSHFPVFSSFHGIRDRPWTVKVLPAMVTPVFPGYFPAIPGVDPDIVGLSINTYTVYWRKNAKTPVFKKRAKRGQFTY